MEKGYYADGEDAYDMRLPFAQNDSYSSGIKPMTPLKQVVVVKPPTAKPLEDAPKQEDEEGEEAGSVEAEQGTKAVDGVVEKLGDLSVKANTKA